MKRLFLGGVKSGKSDLALAELMRAPGPRTMLATGRPLDLSFRRRILEHRAGRDLSVFLREVCLDLPEALAEAAACGGAVLVDSLDFWLFSLLEAGRSAEQARAGLREVLSEQEAGIILVSCETGLGPLAADAATRAFVEALARLNRAVAEACDEIYLVVAGRALRLP
jgi:adenosylcobinamide kinase/adenosylcobinamide-phosphate guanylyltransferase